MVRQGQLNIVFENGVILYGGQCVFDKNILDISFENGVILYGGQWENIRTTITN